MAQTPKTIEIFLPDGDPKSIKVASITSRTVEVTYIPRKKIDEAKKRDNLSGVGVYMLVGLSEEHNKQEIYIGEAESCINRLSQHNANKDFWQYALVVTSRTNQFTKTHGKYLEWLCYTKGKEANRCIVNNATIPTKSHVSESMEADLCDSFETLSVLVSTLGLPIFQPARNPIQEDDRRNIFYIKGRGGEGSGEYTDEGFVVFAGSKFAKELSPTMQKNQSHLKVRTAIILGGSALDKGNHYLLRDDFLFPTPSNAAASVIGHASNGWTAWKRKDGKTLDEVYRQNK